MFYQEIYTKDTGGAKVPWVNSWETRSIWSKIVAGDSEEQARLRCSEAAVVWHLGMHNHLKKSNRTVDQAARCFCFVRLLGGTPAGNWRLLARLFICQQHLLAFMGWTLTIFDNAGLRCLALADASMSDCYVTYRANGS